MERMRFLTDIDSRAAIKGSRDPLRAQASRTLLGRHVVGELTSGTTSVRRLGGLLLGWWFTGKLAREAGLSVFIRFERPASCVLSPNGDRTFRRTMRTPLFLSEERVLTILGQPAFQKLANEGIYRDLLMGAPVRVGV